MGNPNQTNNPNQSCQQPNADHQSEEAVAQRNQTVVQEKDKRPDPRDSERADQQKQ